MGEPLAFGTPGYRDLKRTLEKLYESTLDDIVKAKTEHERKLEETRLKREEEERKAKEAKQKLKAEKRKQNKKQKGKAKGVPKLDPRMAALFQQAGGPPGGDKPNRMKKQRGKKKKSKAQLE